MVRLLSIATVSTGLLLARANLVMPAVSTVLAAEPGNTTTQAAHADAPSVPESNPYADPSQCTAGAWDFAAQAGHKLPWFAGDATDWKQGAIEHGLKTSDTLDSSVVHGVAVWEGGVGGTGSAGHVGYVTEVKGDQFHVHERNWNAPGADGDRWVTWEKGISFIKLENPQPSQPANATQSNPAPAQGSVPARGASAAQAAPAAHATPTINPAPAPQSNDSVQPLVQQFVPQPWLPSQPSADAFTKPLQALDKINLWAPHFGAALSQPVGMPALSVVGGLNTAH